jgi:hypothetical protein
MSTWLYQIRQTNWPTGNFRQEIWEGERWQWSYGSKRSKESPELGDILIFFYAPSGGGDHGFFGWAVVDRHDSNEKTVYFTPTAPTNHLKMDPWSDKVSAQIANDIRGRMT